jgi:outer membrane protein TolC
MVLTILLATSVLTPKGLARQQMRPLTLQQVIEAARQTNLGLNISRANVEAADARVRETFTTFLPQIRASGRFAQLSDIQPFSFSAPTLGTLTLFPNIDHSYAARVSVQQPIFTGFRLLNTLKAAQRNAEAAQEEFHRDEADVILEATVTYWNLYRALRVEEFLKQTVDQVSEHLEDVQNFYRQGLATQNDVYKVEVQRAEVYVKLLEAQNNRNLVNMALNNLVGLPLETVIEPTDDPEAPAWTGESRDMITPRTAGELTSLAQANRPELKALKLRKEMSEANVAAARAGWLPVVALTAGYDYARPNPRIIPPKDRWEGTWDVGLTLQWSLWDWFATAHQTTQAEAAVRKAEAVLEQMERAVTLQVFQHDATMRQAAQRREVAQRAVIQAAESHRMTQEKFKQGVATNTDLLDAEIALLQAKLNYTQAQVDYQIASAQLLHAAGMQVKQPTQR